MRRGFAPQGDGVALHHEAHVEDEEHAERQQQGHQHFRGQTGLAGSREAFAQAFTALARDG